MDQDPPRTRLALPRARSVSHLRSQTSSSIPVPRPGLSRKPSIPLRSNVTTNANANAYVASQRQQTTSSHASSVIVAASTGMRAVPVPGGVRAQSVLELGRRTVTGTGNGDGSSRMDDPFLVRVASHSNPTSRTQHQAKAQTQTLPTRTRPIGQSTTTTTTGGRNKPLPTRPALQGPVTATTTTRSRQVGHTPMALGAKRTVSAVPPTTATAHAQAQAQHTSFKPTSTHKGTGTSTTTLVRKPSGRLRGSPVPAPALALARPQVPFTTTTRTGSGSNITRAPVRPATIPTPAAAAASAPAQPQVPASPSPLPTTEATPGPKLHYGQPPLGRQIRRVVSRGFALSQPTISPDKTIHTPSPTKRSHQFIPASETPLMPRLISRNLPHMPTGDIETMPMIADASFDFGDSTNSNSNSITNNPIPLPAFIPASKSIFNDPNRVNTDHVHACQPTPLVKSQEQQDLEEENELLKSALCALESAAARIKTERDTARQSEESLQAALKNQRWEAVRQAIADEIERTREYREDLGRWKVAIELCIDGSATGGGNDDQTPTPTPIA